MQLTINAGHQEIQTSLYSFNQFRIRLAKSLDKEFGDAYKHYLASGDTDEFFEKAAYCDKLTFELVDFLLADEKNGEISPSVAEQLLLMLRNIDIDPFMFDLQEFYDLLEFSAIWKLSIRWKFKKAKILLKREN